MQPVAAAEPWAVPAITSQGDLADWLCLSTAELEWYADLKGLCAKLENPRLRHYHYRILAKRAGGIRLTESPKPRLKELQRRVLWEILDRIPVHPSVHGFVKGRSTATFAAPHTGKSVVLRLDLQDFFPTFSAARIQALFRTLGYPEPVADLLGGICTSAAPAEIWKRRPPEVNANDWQQARMLYMRRHLPQGGPASPSLANLTSYHLDCRLHGLAESAGAVYTRYADDLAFSGPESFARKVERFSAHAAAIALEEGFHVNHHKTRFMRKSARQQLAGIVVNEKANLRRSDLELLEAILYNSVRYGPESQNRSAIPNFHAHLEGRIGYVQMVTPARGQRLRALFSAIRWS